MDREKLCGYDGDTMPNNAGYVGWWQLDVVPSFSASSIQSGHTLIVYTFCSEGCEREGAAAGNRGGIRGQRWPTMAYDGIQGQRGLVPSDQQSN